MKVIRSSSRSRQQDAKNNSNTRRVTFASFCECVLVDIMLSSNSVTESVVQHSHCCDSELHTCPNFGTRPAYNSAVTYFITPQKLRSYGNQQLAVWTLEKEVVEGTMPGTRVYEEDHAQLGKTSSRHGQSYRWWKQ